MGCYILNSIKSFFVQDNNPPCIDCSEAYEEDFGILMCKNSTSRNGLRYMPCRKARHSKFCKYQIKED